MDMNQIILSSLFARLKNIEEIEEDLVRHIVLNTLRIYKKKFESEYGELVLAYDGGRYWRKEIFPYYKAARKEKQNKDDYDWSRIFSIIGKIRDEVEEIFPYKTIRIEHVEADDIIAVLTKQFHSQEKIMIVSSDKDFQQLQRYENVKQYSPKAKGMITNQDPETYLIRHIIKGDVSDGIPNIISDDDTFVNPDKRQKPCGEKKISSIVEELETWTSNDNWVRNQKLVDFNQIPDWVEEKVLEVWNEPIEGKRSLLFNYFVQNKLKMLMEDIQEF